MTAFHILVVDDEQDIRESLAMAFEAFLEDVKVSTAINGVEGLDILRGGDVDLILSDYKMPIMDGMTFLKAAQKEFPKVPRIMLTAYPDPDVAAKAVEDAGVGLFVAKPFHDEYLVRVIEALREAPDLGRSKP